jgi:hypothetical protein
MQLLQTRVDIFRVWQVVISAPVGRECGGGDSTGQDNVFHHHFQMQLLQTRVDIFRRAGSNFCPCLLGRGGGDSTGQDVPFHHHFQMQLLQTGVNR